MKKMILLFSHRLTQEQKDEAIKKFNISEFVSLPKDLQAIWSNISPDIDSLKEPLKSIKEFLITNSSKGDIILVQGDFGAVYSMVSFCKESGLIALYATTFRQTKEIVKANESIKYSVFKFRKFREYE